MKTKPELLTELDDTLTMLADAVKAQNWTIAGDAAGHVEALCAMLSPRPVTIGDIKESMAKLGALLAKN